MEAGLSVGVTRSAAQAHDAHIALGSAYNALLDTLTDRSQRIEAEARAIYHLRRADELSDGRPDAGPEMGQILAIRARLAAERDPVTYAEEALATALRATQEADARGDDEDRALAYGLLGQAYLRRAEGDPAANVAEAIAAYTTSAALAGTDAVARVSAERGLGDAHRRADGPDATARASEHYSRALAGVCVPDRSGGSAGQWLEIVQLQADQYQADMMSAGFR